MRPCQDIDIGLAMVFDTYSLESWQELVYSYDCLEWCRDALREPYITASPGTWNTALRYSAYDSPIEIGGHHYFYYQDSNKNTVPLCLRQNRKGIFATSVRPGT